MIAQLAVDAREKEPHFFTRRVHRLQQLWSNYCSAASQREGALNVFVCIGEQLRFATRNKLRHRIDHVP